MTEQEWPVYTILIVDDERDTLNMLIEMLDQAHVATLVATDGNAALHQLAEASRLPDLILLDVMMPGIDGFETCRRLKANAATRDIPVLFMTALSDMTRKLTGFAVGGVDYITKPFRVEEVLARVNAHLTIQRQYQQLQAQHLQLQQQQQEIEAQREQLRTLNASKDKFFAILAHDLKGPVMGFLSTANLLKDFDDLNQAQRTIVTTNFRDSAQNLFALLENLLTWAQVQHGLIKFMPQQASLQAFVERNCKLLMPLADQKQIAIHHTIQPDIRVWGDVSMIDTVFRNLLGNAIKFTRPEGAITISATQDDQMITIAVADTGTGIPAEKLSNLFRIDDKFQRDGTAGERGTGLGLILCKEFVEKNGGRIWMESAVDQGTTVRFTLLRAA